MLLLSKGDWSSEWDSNYSSMTKGDWIRWFCPGKSCCTFWIWTGDHMNVESARNVERKTWPRPTLPVRWLKTWIDHKWMIEPRGDALLCEMSQVSQAATRGRLLYSPVITNIVQRGVINHQVSLEPHSHQLYLLVTSWPPLTGRTLARTVLHSTFGPNTQPNIMTQQVDSAVRGRTPPVVALVGSYRLTRLPRLLESKLGYIRTYLCSQLSV